MDKLTTFVDYCLTLGGKEPRQIAATLLIGLIVMYFVMKFFRSIQNFGFKGTMMGAGFYMYQKYKGEKGMQHAIDELKDKIKHALVPKEVEHYTKNLILPKKPTETSELLTTLEKWGTFDNSHWNGEKGLLSGCVYHGDKEFMDFQAKIFAIYIASNPLHPDTFPFLRKMESEVIAMTISYFNGDPMQQCGLMTSGGTESILMAIRSYKNYAKKTKGIIEPELVIPHSAHAAFIKACDMYCIKPVFVPVNQTTFEVEVSDVEKYITKNTIAIVGSAPQFSQGVMDPISELSKLAMQHNVGLHVDCCLGSFLLASLAKLEEGTIPPFDFRCPGVTSISCDTHKFGFATKGTSVVMFRDAELRHNAYFLFPDCCIGMYATPTILGTRCGGVVAATWATMMALGEEGYMKSARTIVDSARKIRAAVNEMKDIKILGNPVTSVVSFASNNSKIDIYNISDAMSKRGWSLNACQHPSCVHICLTSKNCQFTDKFIQDLKDSIDEVLHFPEHFAKSIGALYGTMANLPPTKFKDDVLATLLDVILAAE